MIEKPDKISQINKLYDQAELGRSSETVIRALDPFIERRLGLLLDRFAQTAPELGPLLDLRAQISEVWRMRKELRQDSLKGDAAIEVLKRVFAIDSNNNNQKEKEIA